VNGRVLLVDDEEDLVETLRIRLESEGFEVGTAGDGAAAIEQARLFRPDVVLLDTVMPGMDGWEACRRLKEDPATKKLPIIIFTANCTEASLNRAIAAGADRVIIKPFDPDELLKALKQAGHSPSPPQSKRP